MADELQPKVPKVRKPRGPNAATLLKQALAQLDEQRKEIEQLKAGSPSPRQADLLAAAITELNALKATAALPVFKPMGPKPPTVPYKGLVKAKETCAYLSPRTLGQRKVGDIHEPGDVFEVDVAALWTDDPYEAVVVVGAKDDGTPLTAPNPDAPIPIDFRFRQLADPNALYPAARAV